MLIYTACWISHDAGMNLPNFKFDNRFDGKNEMLQLLSPGKITYYYKVQCHAGVFSIYRDP
jgi:hypothetical protein